MKEYIFSSNFTVLSNFLKTYCINRNRSQIPVPDFNQSIGRIFVDYFSDEYVIFYKINSLILYITYQNLLSASYKVFSAYFRKGFKIFIYLATLLFPRSKMFTFYVVFHDFDIFYAKSYAYSLLIVTKNTQNCREILIRYRCITRADMKYNFPEHGKCARCQGAMGIIFLRRYNFTWLMKVTDSKDVSLRHSLNMIFT